MSSIIRGIVAVAFFSIFGIFMPVYMMPLGLSIRVDDNYFKRIKLKRGKLFFKAVGFESISKHGIILPLFIFQLLSYPYSLGMLIAGIICICKGIAPYFISIALIFEYVVWVLMFLILEIVSKRRKNKHLKRRKNKQ